MPQKLYYLDHAATSPLLPEAKAAMITAMDTPGNASSLHRPGHAAHNLIEESRAEIAQLIGAKPSEIIFTSGGSEANNMVIHTFANQSITVSAIEHPSVLEPAREYASQLVFADLRELFLGCVSEAAAEKERARPREDGRRESRQPKKAIATPLTSIMLANNELGTIFPIKTLAQQAHTEGSYFHTDATQALGKIPIDVKDLDVDYLTASAHKIGGPVGIGILYVKQGAPIQPLILGGHQEHGLRAGTYQTVNVAGFGAAAKYARQHKTWETYDTKIRPLRDLLAHRILTEIPYSSINEFSQSFFEQCPDGNPLQKKGSAKTQLPNILNVSFQAAEGESIQLYLDLKGNIIVSTGSACASGDGKPSHVIMATHGDAEIAHSSIRFSLGLDTTKQDISHIMDTLPAIIKNLQGISTIKTKE